MTSHGSQHSEWGGREGEGRKSGRIDGRGNWDWYVTQDCSKINKKENVDLHSQVTSFS